MILRVSICMAALLSSLYGYLCLQNEITKRRLEIPILAKEINTLKEQNVCLHYEIDRFESPEHLMELASHKEFSHLKQPWLKDVIAMKAQAPLEWERGAKGTTARSSSSVIVGTR